MFLACLFCSLLCSAAPTPEVSKPKALIQEIKSVDDTKKFLYPAIVSAKVNSNVTADLDGHVRKINKSLGAKVRAGEVVLYLENQDPAFTYSAVAVRSPIAGVISAINFQLMTKVAKGEKLFTVMNNESLKINVEIPASEIGQISPGTKGLFRLNLQSENALPVRVVGLSPVIDPRSGTAAAEVEFLPAEGGKEKPRLPPVGTVGQVSFQISSGNVILLPENTLSYLEGKPTVRVIDAANRSHRRIVELGDQRENLFVIKSGLKDGERVVLRANRSLKENEEVEIQAPETGKN